MTVPPRVAMLFAEQSFLCRIYSINKVVVVVVLQPDKTNGRMGLVTSFQGYAPVASVVVLRGT